MDQDEWDCNTSDCSSNMEYMQLLYQEYLLMMHTQQTGRNIDMLCPSLTEDSTRHAHTLHHVQERANQNY